MAELYREFGSGMGSSLDFSDDAIISLCNHESYGTQLSQNNGFAVGKRYLNLQVTSWKECLLEGSLFKKELYEDEKYPHWWLDNVLRNLYKDLSYDELLSLSRVSGSVKTK